VEDLLVEHRFVSASSSSAATDELEGATPESYRVWTPGELL
jgi:hypothetical protein